MDAFNSSLLRGWKLETTYDNTGKRYHQRTSGDECWCSEKEIGHGSYGEVWQERCVSGPAPNTTRAVKHLHKRQSKSFEMSRQELNALVTFSDSQATEYRQHFVQFLGWFDDVNYFYIAMELIEYGDLQQFITAPLPEPEAVSIVAQVAQALQYMHWASFVHRDIKPLNILVSHLGPNWHVKVADFGITKNTEGTALGTRGIGSLGYMAPELYDDSKQYTAAVDVWALGAVAFCLRTGNPPFRSIKHLMDYSRDHRVGFPIRPLGTSSSFCMNFVIGTMAELPERRFTIEHVLAHDWLAGQPGAPEGGDVGNNLTTGENTLGLSPSNTWSTTYGSTESQHSRPLSSATPMTELDEELEPEPEFAPREELIPEIERLAVVDSPQREDSELSIRQGVMEEDIDPKGSVLNLKLTRIFAFDLYKKDFFRSPDPFVSIYIDGDHIHSTSVLKRTRSPLWNEDLDIKLNKDSILQFSVFDDRNLGKTDEGFLGHVDVRVEDIYDIIDKGNQDLYRYLQDAKENLLKQNAGLLITMSAHLTPESTSDAGIDRLYASAEHAFGVDNIPQDPNPYKVDFAKDNARSSESGNDDWPFEAKRIIGVSLNDLYKRDGVAVPSFLSQCFLAVEKFGLYREGIYRISAVPGDVDRVISALETNRPVNFDDPANFLHSIDNITRLVKRFLEELPDRVFPSQFSSQLDEAARIESDSRRCDSLRAIMKALPHAHYAVARVVFLHLHNVQKHSATNHMPIGDLAKFLGPALMAGEAGWGPVQIILINTETILKNTSRIFDDE